MSPPRPDARFAAALLAALVLALASGALAWSGKSRGHLQWLAPDASATDRVTLVVNHTPNGRTRLVGTASLPDPRGDGVVSLRIERAVINAGKITLPDPGVDLRYTEYGQDGRLIFLSSGPTAGTLRFDAFSGGLDLSFQVTLQDEGAEGGWRQLAYAGEPLEPLDPDDLSEPPTADPGADFVAAVVAPDNGCGSGYYDEDDYVDRRDREEDIRENDRSDDSDDWRWDTTATEAANASSGCDDDDVGSESGDSGGCAGDDVSSEASSDGGGCDSDTTGGSGCEGSSEAGSGCSEAASGCDCGGDALASARKRGRRPWVARAVSWLPYFAVFGILRLMRRRRR